jgi:hypothetical protein
MTDYINQIANTPEVQICATCYSEAVRLYSDKGVHKSLEALIRAIIAALPIEADIISFGALAVSDEMVKFSSPAQMARAAITAYQAKLKELNDG